MHGWREGGESHEGEAREVGRVVEQSNGRREEATRVFRRDRCGTSSTAQAGTRKLQLAMIAATH
jgi:hypothetical protein